MSNLQIKRHMKKISIFLMGAMALGFVACEDGPSEVPVQTNPQGPVFETGNVAAAQAGPLTSGNLDLANYEASNIEIAKVQSISEEVGEVSVSFGFEYASSEDFNDAIEIPVVMNGTTGSISGDALLTAHIAKFGKSPAPKTVYYRIPMYVTKDNVEYRWGGSNYYVANSSYQETIPVTTIIEDAYYIIGGMNNWNFAEAANFKFEHSNASVYDDPIFTIQFVVDAPDCYWKIVPQSALDTENWDALLGVAVDGDDASSGLLVDENVNAGKFPEAGTYKMTINMMDMTYSWQLFTNPMELYCPGGANGWGFGDNCSRVPFLSEEGWQYQGAIYADGEFKFTAAPNWDLNWGTGDEAGKLYEGGGNITAEKGLQWAKVELVNYTYELVHLSSAGIVGGLNGWDINGYYEMTPNEEGNIWTWTGELTGEWKIAFNHSWDYNYGGNIANPEFGGSNIDGYEGTYTVTFDCSGALPVIQVK